MTIQENNKALVTKIILEYWRSWPGLDALAAYLAPGYVHHAAIGDFDFEGFKRGLGAFIDAFADPHYSIHHLIAEGDLVAAYVKLTATHTGQFGPVAPAGKVLNMTGIYHCRIVDGQLVEDWDSWTALPLHRQTIAMLQS